MNNLLEIERIPYEEPHLINLKFSASNKYSCGRLEIYENAEFLNTMANKLEQFPGRQQDEFKWELGSEKAEDRFAFYFLFRVVYAPTEDWPSAIHIKFNNNAEMPFTEISEFYIRCEPAGINRLGKLFREFAKLNSKKLIWDGINGEIID